MSRDMKPSNVYICATGLVRIYLIPVAQIVITWLGSRVTHCHGMGHIFCELTTTLLNLLMLDRKHKSLNCYVYYHV